MSIETLNLAEIKKKPPTISDILKLKDEIENWAQFFEIRDIIESPITVDNIEIYLKSYRNLVKNYYKQNKNSEFKDEIEIAYQLGKENISVLENILDALIELYHLKNPTLNKELLYEKWTIPDLMKKLWYNDKSIVLNKNFFFELEDEIWEYLDNAVDNSTEWSDSNYDNLTNYRIPKNHIGKWLQESNTETNVIEQNLNYEFAKKLIEKLKTQDINAYNYSEFKKNLKVLLVMRNNNPDYKELIPVEDIENISVKLFKIIYIENTLSELFPSVEYWDLLKKSNWKNLNLEYLNELIIKLSKENNSQFKLNFEDLYMDSQEEELNFYIKSIVSKEKEQAN